MEHKWKGILVNDKTLEEWFEKQTGVDLKRVMREEVKGKRRLLAPLRSKTKPQVRHYSRSSPVRILSKQQINQEYGGIMLKSYITGPYTKAEKIIAMITFNFLKSSFTTRQLYENILGFGAKAIPPSDVSSIMSRIMKSDLGMFFEIENKGRLPKEAFLYNVDERIGLLTVDELYELYKKGGRSGEDFCSKAPAIAPLWEVFRREKRSSRVPLRDEKKPKDLEKALLDVEPDMKPDQMVYIPDNMLVGLLEILKMHDVKTKISGRIVIHIGEEEVNGGE